MADEQTSTTDTPPTQAAPATQPGSAAPSLTQADIEAAAKRAHDAAWAEARRKYEGKQSTPAAQQQPKPETAPTTTQPAADVRSEINRIRAFERAAGQYGLSPEALELLESDFQVANPPDAAAWVQTRAKAYGWKASGQTSTPAPAASTATPNPPPSGAPVTSTAAPASATATVTDDVPIHRLSEADRQSLLRRVGIKAYTDRMFKEWRETGLRVRLR